MEKNKTLNCNVNKNEQRVFKPIQKDNNLHELNKYNIIYLVNWNGIIHLLAETLPDCTLDGDPTLPHCTLDGDPTMLHCTLAGDPTLLHCILDTETPPPIPLIVELAISILDKENKLMINVLNYRYYGIIK